MTSTQTVISSATPTRTPANELLSVQQQQQSDTKKSLYPFSIQRKLSIGAADDPLEHEADAMADKVMRMPNPEPISFSASKSFISRKCSECEKEEELQRKESNNETTSAASPMVQDVLSSPGRSLDSDSRSFMESRFNYDFANVKIHDNELAAKSAGSINALAYTSGNNIVFNAGQYNTASDSGKRLLAHELTHVVQQNGPNVQKQEETVPKASPLSDNAPAKFIVDDDMEPSEGQMRKSDFLERLNFEICATVNETMQGTPFSSDNCPYIRAAFARHQNSSPIQLGQLIEKYAPATAFGQSIDEVIGLMKIRVANAAVQWLQNGGNLSGFTDEATSLVPGESPQANNQMVCFKSNHGESYATQSPATIRRILGTGSPIDGSTRSKMEGAFGSSFSDVQVHTDSNASSLSSKMNARAFTVGNHIAFSNGQHQPGTLIGDALMAHELAHVIQQKSSNSNGYPDNVVEEDADQTAIAVMAKTISGKDIDLFRKENKAVKTGLRLSRCPGCADNSTPSPTPTPTPAPPPPPPPPNKDGSKATTAFGEFEAVKYHALTQVSDGKEAGVEILLKFNPGTNVDAKQIALTQSVTGKVTGTPLNTKAPNYGRRSATVGAGRGHFVDVLDNYPSPLYVTQENPTAGSDASKLTSYPVNPARALTPAQITNVESSTGIKGHTYDGFGKHGYRYMDGAALKGPESAVLYDAPNFGALNNDSENIFESTALAIEGTQKNTYYGSVQWGWKRDTTGAFSMVDFKAISQATPSVNFLTAANIWNSATEDFNWGVNVASANILDPADPTKTLVAVTRGTALERGNTGPIGGVNHTVVRVKGTPTIGLILTGQIAMMDVGRPTVDLPVSEVYKINAADTEMVSDPTKPTTTLIQKLPKDTTRVLILDNKTNKAWYKIKITDGPDTNKEGWVNKTKLTREALGTR